MKTTLFALTISILLHSCTSDEPKKPLLPAISKTELPKPFRFHKAIEVKPGLTFDVLSWGRGSSLEGQYLILRSDSSEVQHHTVSEDLEGTLVDAWNMDMDSDGNPEIFIQTTDKESLLHLYVHEFFASGSSQLIKFPELTSATKKRYRGKDSVYTKEGNLFREFPLYDESDTSALKITEKKVVEYTIRGNRFDIHEIESSDKKENKK